MLFQLARISIEPARLTRIDLVALARRVTAEHVPMALQNGSDIAFADPGCSVWVLGSETAITVALSNLIRNAVHHAGSETPILVTVAAPARVSVVDSGRGLNLGEHDALFEPFRRGSAEADGVGLGLSIVFQVMTIHQGNLAVRETPGGGTTVELSFPVEENQGASIQSEAA